MMEIREWWWQSSELCDETGETEKAAATSQEWSEMGEQSATNMGSQCPAGHGWRDCGQMSSSIGSETVPANQPPQSRRMVKFQRPAVVPPDINTISALRSVWRGGIPRVLTTEERAPEECLQVGRLCTAWIMVMISRWSASPQTHWVVNVQHVNLVVCFQSRCQELLARSFVFFGGWVS